MDLTFRNNNPETSLEKCSEEVEYLYNLIRAEPNFVSQAHLLSHEENEKIIFNILQRPQKKQKEIALLVLYLRTFDKFLLSIQSENKATKKLNSFLGRICDTLFLEKYRAGSFFCRVNEKGDNWYLILRGSVTILLPIMKVVKMTRDQYRAHLKFLRLWNELFLLGKTIRENQNVYEIKNSEYSINLEVPFEPSPPGGRLIKNLNHYLAELEGKTIKEEFHSLQVKIYCYKVITTLGEGNSFGENALLNETHMRTATVYVDRDLYCGVMKKSDYALTIKKLQFKLRRENILFILSFGLFDGILYHNFVSNFWNGFAYKRIKQGDYIFRQGEKQSKIFFLHEGQVRIYSTLSKKNIDVLLTHFTRENHIQKDGDKDKFYEVTDDVNLTMLNNEDLIGVGDFVYHGKYFANAKCMSKYACYFEINLEFLAYLGKKDNKLNENWDKIAKEKMSITVERLKLVRKAKDYQMSFKPMKKLKGLKNISCEVASFFKPEMKLKYISKSKKMNRTSLADAFNSTSKKHLRLNSKERQANTANSLSMNNNEVEKSPQKKKENSPFKFIKPLNTTSISTNYNNNTTTNSSRKRLFPSSAKKIKFNNALINSSVISNMNMTSTSTEMKSFTNNTNVGGQKLRPKSRNQHVMKLAKPVLMKPKLLRSTKRLRISTEMDHEMFVSMSTVQNSRVNTECACPVNYIDCLIMDKEMNNRAMKNISLINSGEVCSNLRVKIRKTLPFNYMNKAAPFRLHIQKNKCK